MNRCARCKSPVAASSSAESPSPVEPADKKTVLRADTRAPSLLNAIEMRPGPQEKRSARNRRRRHEPGFELILGKNFELPSSLNHRRLAFLAEKVNAPLAIDLRRRVVASDPLAPAFRAGLRVETTRHATIVDAKQ